MTPRMQNGQVWCPRCGDGRGRWLPPEAFRPVPERATPYHSRCRACEREETRRRMTRRALRDPVWYAAYTRRTRNRDRNARRNAAIHQAMLDRREDARVALAFLESRGLLVREIVALTGMHRETLQRWRKGRGRRHDVPRRLAQLAAAASDLPPMTRKRGTTHPAYDVIARRLEMV